MGIFYGQVSTHKYETCEKMQKNQEKPYSSAFPIDFYFSLKTVEKGGKEKQVPSEIFLLG